MVNMGDSKTIVHASYTGPDRRVTPDRRSRDRRFEDVVMVVDRRRELSDRRSGRERRASIAQILHTPILRPDGTTH